MQEPEVTGKRTRFEDSDEEGECSDSPPTKKSCSTTGLVNSDVVKGTEVDYGEFMLDRTVSFDIDETGDHLSAAAEWSGSLSSLLTPTSSSDKQAAPARPKFKMTCFNCEGEHNLYNCPEPKNMRRIRERQAAFNEMKNKGDRARYHADEPANGESNYRAGRLSNDLRKALGIGPDDIPEYIYRMRRMGFIEGYPPGYLKKAIVKDDTEEVLDFHLITAEEKVEVEVKEREDNSVPPVIDSNKMIFYFGFNKTYHKLRDRESFQVPPFEVFVDFHNENLATKFVEERKVQQKMREFDKEQREKRKQELEDEGDIVILPPPPKPSFDNSDDDIIVLDRDGMKTPEPEPEADASPPIDVFKTPSLPAAVPRTPGSSASVTIGTPIPRWTRNGDVLSTSCPDLSKFSVGIVPFTATEEPTPHKGFLRKITEKIRQLTGNEK